jgi:hypothetical protein
MLKLSELRIGNIITDKWASEEKGFPVYFVHPIGKVKYGNSIKYSANIEDIRPVPLTEEWLMKFGAKQDKLERTWYLGDFEIMLPNFFVYKMDCHIRKIKYVHDFQNLYHALCGRELKVENVCYKSNETCKYDCSGLCKDSA